MHPSDRNRIASWMCDVRLRLAHASDRAALDRLAVLDSKQPLPAPQLIAMCDGDPCAAISLATGEVVADPFRRTAEVVQLLRCHAGGARVEQGIDVRPQSDLISMAAA
jgi:hypothetical protein